MMCSSSVTLKEICRNKKHTHIYICSQWGENDLIVPVTSNVQQQPRRVPTENEWERLRSCCSATFGVHPRMCAKSTHITATFSTTATLLLLQGLWTNSSPQIKSNNSMIEWQGAREHNNTPNRNVQFSKMLIYCLQDVWSLPPSLHSDCLSCSTPWLWFPGH